MRRPIVKPLVMVAVTYCTLALVPEWRYWQPGGTMMAAAGGDPATGAWFLSWTPYALAHGLNPLVSDWGNYPAGVNAVTGIGMPLLGLAGAPVTWLGGPYLTLTLMFTLAFALSALGGYALAREYVGWRPAAFTAGLLYGFSPYMVTHGHYHLNLVFVPLPPLIFLALGRLCRGDSVRSGFALGLLCVAQFFIAPEVLASTAVIGVIALAAAAVVARGAVWPRLRLMARAAAAAVGTAAVCLAYPVWLLIAGPGHVTGVVQRTSLFRGDLLGPVIPDSLMFFRAGSSTALADRFSGTWGENGLYLGVPLLLILACGVVLIWRRQPVTRIVAPVTVASFILSLGSRLVVGNHVYRSVPLPDAVLDHIPLLDNTIAARYSLYTVLGAAVLLALILEHVHERLPGRAWTRMLAPAALAVVALLPLLPAWPFPGRTWQVPAYFTADRVTAEIPAGSVAVTYPFPTLRDAYPMLWQVSAGMRYKTPGGRFIAPLPAVAADSVEGVFTSMAAGDQVTRTPELRATLIEQLRSWQVRSVLVQPAGGANPAVVVPFFTWLLGRAPDRSAGGISAWYGPPLWLTSSSTTGGGHGRLVGGSGGDTPAPRARYPDGRTGQDRAPARHRPADRPRADRAARRSGHLPRDRPAHRLRQL